MAGNTFGKFFKVTTWGESHGKAVGAVIDGCPAGINISEKDINKELEKRRPGFLKFVSPRKEEDIVEILSGVFEGKTLGTPISLVVYNKDVDSSFYEKIKGIFRPGHGDYTYFKKYGVYDWRGGGRASARETAARVAAGAVAKKLLDKIGIEIFVYTLEFGGIRAKKVDLKEIEKNSFYSPDKRFTEAIKSRFEEIKRKKDSVGGIVEVIIKKLPAGIGEPVFDKLEAVLGKAILSIPAVKGVEFGKGFNCAKMLGSEHNDEITSSGFLSNNAGGILGGISSGEDVVFRLAVKPIASISLTQKTVNIKNENVDISIVGRHDVSAIPRIIPVVKAMTTIAIVDMIMEHRAMSL